MAKNYFNRYVWLIDTIRQARYISREQIGIRWKQSHWNETREELPERTFHNHLRAIADIFGIEICYDPGHRGYCIAEEDTGEGSVKGRLLEMLSLSNLACEARGLRGRLLFERIPSSERWLPVLVGAMREGKAVEMTYQSFDRGEPTTFVADPYCLKLFRQRWYVLAMREDKPYPRIYSLDGRMLHVARTDRDSHLPDGFDAEAFFSHYFGISVRDGGEPEEVKIRVSAVQARYFDTLPLHPSQCKVPGESDAEHVVYSYRLVPTFDFRQELLRHGSAVEVLSPADFRQELREDIKAMARNYGISIPARRRTT